MGKRTDKRNIRVGSPEVTGFQLAVLASFAELGDRTFDDAVQVGKQICGPVYTRIDETPGPRALTAVVLAFSRLRTHRYLRDFGRRKMLQLSIPGLLLLTHHGALVGWKNTENVASDKTDEARKERNRRKKKAAKITKVSVMVPGTKQRLKGFDLRVLIDLWSVGRQQVSPRDLAELVRASSCMGSASSVRGALSRLDKLGLIKINHAGACLDSDMDVAVTDFGVKTLHAYGRKVGGGVFRQWNAPPIGAPLSEERASDVGGVLGPGLGSSDERVVLAAAAVSRQDKSDVVSMRDVAEMIRFQTVDDGTRLKVVASRLQRRGLFEYYDSDEFNRVTDAGYEVLGRLHENGWFQSLESGGPLEDELSLTKEARRRLSSMYERTSRSKVVVPGDKPDSQKPSPYERACAAVKTAVVEVCAVMPSVSRSVLGDYAEFVDVARKVEERLTMAAKHERQSNATAERE
jgi:hypothetical protein